MRLSDKLTSVLLALVLFVSLGSIFSAEASETLTIYGGATYSLMEAYEKNHPNVNVNQLPNMEADQILANAIAHDVQPDVYCFNSLSAPFFYSMRERGYLAEITDDASAALVNSMFEGVRDECYDANQTLRAIPVATVVQNRLGVNTAVWEVLGLGEMPTTWDEMFDFLEQWCASPEAHESIALLGYESAAETRKAFGYILLDDYDIYRASFDEPMKYSTEVYQRLLHRLQDVPFENLSYNTEAEATLMTSMYIPTPMNNLFADLSQTCLQLSIDGVTPTRTETIVYFACVNPSSPNQELAMEFIRYLAQNLSQETLATLCPGYDREVESDALEQLKRAYDEKMDELQARMDATDDEAERTAITLEINQCIQDYNADVKNKGYFIDAQTLAKYQSDVKDGLYVTYGDGVLDEEALGDLSEKHEMFIARQLTVEEYTEVMDQMMYMQEMEWKQ